MPPSLYSADSLVSSYNTDPAMVRVHTLLRSDSIQLQNLLDEYLSSTDLEAGESPRPRSIQGCIDFRAESMAAKVVTTETATAVGGTTYNRWITVH